MYGTIWMRVIFAKICIKDCINELAWHLAQILAQVPRLFLKPNLLIFMVKMTLVWHFASFCQ